MAVGTIETMAEALSKPGDEAVTLTSTGPSSALRYTLAPFGPLPTVAEAPPTSRLLLEIRSFDGSLLVTVIFGGAGAVGGRFASCGMSTPRILRPTDCGETLKLGCGALTRSGPRPTGATNPGGFVSEICASPPLA